MIEEKNLETRLGFLQIVDGILIREYNFRILPDEEKTTEAEAQLKAEVRDSIVSLYKQYSPLLIGTPELCYLERLAVEAGMELNTEITVDEFIKKHPLSTRTENILLNLEYCGSKKAGIKKIQGPYELCQYDASILRKVTDLGIGSLRELAYVFRQEGWKIHGIEKYVKKI